MPYNHGKEERKWQRWKLAEEKVLRACGVDESTIEELRIWDRAMFNSDRRFYERGCRKQVHTLTAWLGMNRQPRFTLWMI